MKLVMHSTKNPRVLTGIGSAAIVSVAMALCPSSASALAFDWSWTATGGSGGPTPQTITGTIFGLVDGVNTGSGVTAIVTNPGVGLSSMLGQVFNFSSRPDLSIADAFTVSGGAVTMANAGFSGAAGTFSRHCW